MPRRHAAQVSHERWLVSYADFVTLLFAFFVVLYASAQVDRRRAMELSDAIRSGFRQLGVFQAEASEKDGRMLRAAGMNGNAAVPAATAHRTESGEGAEFAQIRSELEEALAAEIRRKEVELHMGPDGLIVTLREVGFFDSGSATIRPGAEPAFAHVAGILRAHNCALRIEGHTDNMPIHTAQFASNWELSTARATGLVKAMAEQYGISPELLSAAGYGEFRPVGSNNTVKGRALNRRIDVVVLRSRTSAR